MASVFGNAFRLRSGASVWANVFVLEEPPSQAGWIARTANRLSVSAEQQRVALFSAQQRVWITRSDNE